MPPRRDVDLLSVVAPVFNESETIEEFSRRVVAALDSVPFELILVDDGSTDGSGAIVNQLADADARIRVIQLSRNFGHQPALTAGLDNATGNVAVMLDSDLQDPPEIILTMLERWRDGSDVVYAVREEREGESLFKLKTASLFYRLFDRLSTFPLRDNSGDFRLLDRRALDALVSMHERNRFLRGMTVWIGFTQSSVTYHRDPRYAGQTKFSLSRMVRFSLDALTSFSHRPLQLATMLGFGFSALALVGIPVVIVLKIFGDYLPGFSAIEVTLLLIGGIQLITVGLVGEYVGRIFDEVKDRPLYIVQNTQNFEAAAKVSQSDEGSSPGAGSSLQ